MSNVRISQLPAATAANPTDAFIVDQGSNTRQLSLAQIQTETVYAIADGAVDLTPDNGTIQTWILGGNRTPTESFTAGQSMTLMVRGASYTITWPSVTWVSGITPVLPTTGYAVIVLWKVGTTLYGQSAGTVA